jgi:hypothetical protein
MHRYTFMACPQMHGLANRIASQYYGREIDVSPLILEQSIFSILPIPVLRRSR